MAALGNGDLRHGPNFGDIIDDVATIAIINKPLPGGRATQYFRWYDYFLFSQDTRQVRPTLVHSLGLWLQWKADAS